MCGRFTLHIPPELIAEAFNVPLPGVFTPRFNGAPSQTHPVVCSTANGRQIAQMRWGLVPQWAQDDRLGYTMINARAETVTEKPAFRGLFAGRRCLVIADGFYEWRHDGNAKEPFYIALRDGRLMSFAGLWDKWRNEAGETVYTFTIITCASNDLVRPLHDRMPVVIERKHYDLWLDPAAPPDKVKELLRPYPAGRMTLWKVGALVNNPRNDTAECMEKV